MKKFICRKVAGIERATFLETELFNGFFFLYFKNFAYFSGINI